MNTYWLKVKGKQKIFFVNSNQKGGEVAIPISEKKIDF
jgi:hypothetical protein